MGRTNFWQAALLPLWVERCSIQRDGRLLHKHFPRLVLI